MMSVTTASAVDRISVFGLSLNFKGVILPSWQPPLDLAGPCAQAQRLQRLCDEALRGRDAQHQQQLGVSTW